MAPIIEETTGLYGITCGSLARYRCRIGRRPYIHLVSKFEAYAQKKNDTSEGAVHDIPDYFTGSRSP